jgi:hypothetical protein
VTAPDKPDDSVRIAWRDAAPWPGSPERDMGESTLGPDGTRVALRAHFGAMAWAHLTEYGERLRNWTKHCDDCAGAFQPHAGEYLRGLVRDLLEPGIAAFSAAALLSGWDAERVVRVVEDAQAMDECLSYWAPIDPDLIAPASDPIPAHPACPECDAGTVSLPDLDGVRTELPCGWCDGTARRTGGAS